MTLKKKTIKDLNHISGKTVFVTVDFNISLNNGQIANDTRIKEALPTINHLLAKGAKLILASHLGRPKGFDKSLSLLPVAERLSHLVKRKVHLVDNFWDKKAIFTISGIPGTDLIMLENIRFYKGEEENDREFCRHLASMADFFVNDAFGTSHRVHASIVGIAEFLPSYAGLLMARELEMLSSALHNPKRPFLVLIGGAKTPEKIAVIQSILDIADTVALGGAIANTFLAAWGFGMGKSMIDYEMIEMARVVFWKATKKHSALILPLDVVIGSEDKRGKPQIVDYNKVPAHVAIYDIGPKTQQHYKEFIKNAKTIIWNGPMGLYEDKIYSTGTDSILKNMSKTQAFSIIGGGDTLTSIRNKAYLKNITHVSTGGSAMLEYMKLRTLPGIEVLQDA